MSPELTLASPQLLSDQDLYLFNEGSNYCLYEKMGAHLVIEKFGRDRLWALREAAQKLGDKRANRRLQVVHDRG